MGDTKKSLRPLGHLEGLPLAPLKMALTPSLLKKKIVWIIGFIVFKSTGSDSQSQDITKKVLNIGLPNQTSKIWHILADISGLSAYFSKPIFVFKPLAQASRFEYHEPYKQNKKFFEL